MKARSVRVAGIEIIDSVKTVAFVFTETLLFMVWFSAIVYGLYRVVIVLWDDPLKPQSLMEFLNFIVPSLAVIAVALIAVLSICKILSAIWEGRKQ